MIDLRSDTVTRPGTAMRAAMATAEVGDDVYGEDPTVTRLEHMLAEMAGMQAGLYVPSGTQSNLAALMSHCERGDEYIVGQQGHTYKYEGGGAAVLGSIQPQPLEYAADGSLPLDKVAAAIKSDDPHFARTRLLCLENTQAGRVLPLPYLSAAAEFARAHTLGMHLDGARIFNAAVKLGVPLTELARHFDTVSICLSKGLGAPVGSVLVGSQELIQKARRWRKVLGGGMRQAGIVAAAGIYALEHHIGRLADDHENALLLAQGLAGIGELEVDPGQVQTNMVFVGIPAASIQPLIEHMRDNGILITAGPQLRLVTHLDVSRPDILKVVNTMKGFFSMNPLPATAEDRPC